MMGAFKTLLILAVLAGAGYGAYLLFWRNSPRASCAKVATLCGGPSGKSAQQKCEALFPRLERAAGREQVDKTHRCLRNSESCAAALGCVIGASLGAAGEFVKGLQHALGKE